MDICDVAWAVGLFEAEGSITHSLPKGRKTRRPTLDVSQAGTETAPVVLVRFREIVEGGSLFGPYRGYLYYWRTHDASLISRVVVLLWPWLSRERREQIAATLAVIPALWAAEACATLWTLRLDQFRDVQMARAWAGGFFEGDGTIGAYSSRTRPGSRPTLNASISQASASHVPTSLEAFRSVIGVGSIRGPIEPRGWSRLPQYRWEASGRRLARALAPLTPWIFGPKRDQVADALAKWAAPQLAPRALGAERGTRSVAGR
jgi:hypothetical protein